MLPLLVEDLLRIAGTSGKRYLPPSSNRKVWVMTPAQYCKWRFYTKSLIDQAIEILNPIDGDPDLEDDEDREPSLAAPVGGESQLCWSAGSDDDREQGMPAA